MKYSEIAPITRSPDVIPIVAEWIWNEFWSDGNGYSQDDLIGLLSSATDDVIPMCWIARHRGNLAGCVNLIENDDAQRPHLRPWLAALYVHPPYRCQGIGRSLVETALGALVTLKEPSVFLGTDNPDFYLKLGAKVQEVPTGSSIQIMRFDLIDRILN